MKEGLLKITLSNTAPVPRFLLIAVVCLLAMGLEAAGPSPVPARIETDFSKAAPRSVEDLTQRSIARDYSSAWNSLTAALSSNSADALNGYFVGPAKSGLLNAIADQTRLKLQTYYTSSGHKVEAVFYAPEGDVMMLHDTVELDIRLTVDGKAIHEEHVVLRYVVLMTPAADRWVIRQLQAVPQF